MGGAGIEASEGERNKATKDERMNTQRLDRALERYRAAREAAIQAGIPANRLDGVLIAGDSEEIKRYNRASRAVERVAKAAYETHQR